MFDFGDQVHKKIARRREFVFIIIAGFFLGTLAIINILGISRQIDMSFTVFGKSIPFIVFIGVLPYPMTFLCTDFISELYGKQRATMVVIVGFLINLFVLFLLWLGGVLPPERTPIDYQMLLSQTPSSTTVEGFASMMDESLSNNWYVFFQIRKWTFGAVIASMLAYLTAQFVDVYVFHFFKRLTKGRHLWLRNNASTLTSQLVDSIAVVTITYFYAKDAIQLAPGKTVFIGLGILIASNYFFKMISALLDTIPFYFGVKFLSKYLQIDPNKGYRGKDEDDKKLDFPKI